MIELPAALAPMGTYRQFILWRSLPDGGKRPVNPHTGATHNAHDPAIWLDADAAIALAAPMGLGVGFVFTDNDPFFFLDIDKCLQDDGIWSPLATSLCAQFQGAAVEISQSGRGLHIFGTGQPPAHSCKNQAHGLELYTQDRFVALTGMGATGDASLDCRTPLYSLASQYFPPSAAAESAEWTTEPCEEWAGIADDDELIVRMIASKSAGGVFGGRASVADLWTADSEALEAAYPDPRGWDHSSADAALCQHLAFWTGKDCERIDRLFRRSSLYREKWEDRPDYRQRTILHAVGYCKKVYGEGKRQPVEPGAPLDIQTGVSAQSGGVLKTGYQLLAVSQQLDLFKGCVYIRDLHRVFTPDGALLKSDQFKADYGGYVFVMDAINDKVTKNAWEVFTESQAVRFPKAHAICFRPECEPGALIEEEGRVLLNSYVPVETPRQQGDPTPFLDHLRRVLPVESDQAILLAYMAACVQYPGVKFQWAPLLQGCEGNGKTLFTRCVAFAVGSRYTHMPPANEISEKFNEWLFSKIFIGIEDIYVPDHKKEIIEILKPMITNDRLAMRAMQQSQVMGDNRANFILNSNHKDGVRKTQTDRRFSVFYTAQQTSEDMVKSDMGGDYFPRLYKWLREGGYAIINDYLRSYQIPDVLNPATHLMRAPDTSSTGEALIAGLGGIEQEVLEAIDEGRPGFAGGWVSSMAFDRLLELRKDNKKLPHNKRRELLQTLGYVLHPGLSDGRVNSPIPFDNGKPRLYVKVGHLAAELKQPCEIARQYLKAQGLGGAGVMGGTGVAVAP